MISTDHNRPSWSQIATQTWSRAQELRKNMTSAERKLWQALRRHQLGVNFRRQHPIGPFIADFYCPERGLIVEVNGDTHANPREIEHDEARTRFFREQSLRVRRFTNYDVQHGLEKVVVEIQTALNDNTPPLSPPRKRGGD